MKKIPVLLFVFLISLGASGQSYRFFSYGLSEGLCDKFAYTINQDQNGFLWVGTTQGLCRFDGNSFDQSFRGDSLPVSIAFSSLRDSRDRLWMGYENGMLAMMEKEVIRILSVSDDFRSTIRDIREDADGNILILLQQSGISRISGDLEVQTIGGDPAGEDNPFAGKFLNTFQVTGDGNLLVGTNDGLSIYRYDTDLATYIHTGDIPELQYMVIQKIVKTVGSDEYWVGTEDEGLWSISGSGYDPAGYTSKKIGEEMGLGWARITSIVFDGPRRAWITDYGKGIYRFELDENGSLAGSVLFNEENGLPSNYINHVFIDEEGNQWFSSQGNGIGVLRDQAFTFFGVWEEGQVEDITALYSRGDRHWFGGMSVIGTYEGDENTRVSYLDVSNGLPNDKVSALYLDGGNNLYIGTEKSGLYLKRSNSNRISPVYISGNSLENIINAIDGAGDSIFVATNNGVYVMNLSTRERSSYSTTNGLPHNKINEVMVDPDGTAWLGTITSGLVGISPNNSLRQVFLKERIKLELVALAQDEEGAIWAATNSDGVFRFHEDSLSWYNEDRGLMSDYTYAVDIDPSGRVWVGHRQGLSRIDPKRGTVRVFGKESGFISDISARAILTTENGRLLLGSTEGMIRYDAFQAKEDTIPPRLSLKSVLISDVPYDPSEDIRLKFGRYKLRIDFVGINLSNPDQVKYQYKLDGYESEWSDISSVPYAFYGRIEDGNFTFMLRACDGNGNCSEQALTFNIFVKIPVWKAWWFILSVVMLVLATIFIVFKVRERNQKAIQEYLQRQLDERTREVIQQKEEIEIKNRDITDSINYAQRIQASILPPIRKLHDAFSGSFVFYQPRDIVSGDFYWYEKVGRNRFLVVCADSTGHGVPGAFMSMIGTTLIKDICLRAGVHTPSEILNTLDREVRESLNQNMETSGSNDGMDIIVADIDLSSYKVILSSAMRPVIIYSGQEQIYVKGNRSSIGGQLDEDRTEKEFTDQVFHLNKGDILYMFSDGYPDQFGGPLGRKFKMVRLKNLLRDIHEKPMDEQYNYIKSNFFLWKEDLEQVDDVLFMGIKL